MKKIMFLLIIFILFVGCISPSQLELYKITDYFVNSISSEDVSYSIVDVKNSKITKDGLYSVSPIGRLIKVNIENCVGFDDYKQLKEDLSLYYKNDARVHGVYICNVKTIVVDCRY